MVSLRNYSDEARQAVLDAQTEACDLGHGIVGTEHLLLGILRTNSLATEALGRFGMTHETVKPRVKALVGSSQKRSVMRLPWTSGAEEILEHAKREVLILGEGSVKPEHILLALGAVMRGVAREIMKQDFRADADRIRASVIELRQAAAAVPAVSTA